MNIWSNAVMTTAGLALQARLTTGQTLSITKVQAGAGTVSVSQLPSQTAVTTPKQTLTIRQVTSDANSAALTCYLENDNVSTGYTATQIGVFAQDPVAGEILYFIVQAASGQGTEIPSSEEMPGYTAEWTFYFGFGQADSVSVTVDPANTVSQAQVTTMISTALTGATFNASQITAGTLPVTRGGTGQTSIDTTPTSGSSKMVTSGGVYTALHAINTSQITAGTLPLARGGTGQTSRDTTPTSGSTTWVTSGGIYTALGNKQNKITYGTGNPSGGSNGDVYIRYNA